MKKIKLSRRVVFGRLLTILNMLSPILDLWLGYRFLTLFPKGHKLYYFGFFLGLFWLGFTLFRSFRGFWLVINSRTKAQEYLLNNRVIPIRGKQRVGKSSLACYFLGLCGGSAYSNVPIKLNGRYTHKLTPEILNIKTKVPERACLLVDEANLFYHNLFTDTDYNLFGQAVLCQCIGHFFDGNIIYCAVDTDRLPKIIRDNYSASLQVFSSESFQISILGALAVRLIASLLLRGERIYTGLRVWNAQHYERIAEPQYIGLVGQTEKDNKFSPVLKFAMFQKFGLNSYDDRYMKFYYDDKPKDPSKRWESLQLNYTDFNNLYDGEVIKYLNSIKKPEKKIVIKNEVKDNDSKTDSRKT